MIVSCDYNNQSSTNTNTTNTKNTSNSEYDGFIAVVYRGTSSSKDAMIDAKATLVPFQIPYLPQQRKLETTPTVETETTIATTTVPTTTSTTPNTNTDSSTTLYNPDACMIHGGFNEAFFADNLNLVVNVIELDKVRALKPKHKLVFTGHSLGAALTTLASIHTACRLPQEKVLCVNFGCPRVGTIEFKRYVENCIPNLAIWRVVLQDDIVARLPPVSLNFEHTGHTIDLDNQRNYAAAHYLHVGDQERSFVGVKAEEWDRKYYITKLFICSFLLTK